MVSFRIVIVVQHRWGLLASPDERQTIPDSLGSLVPSPVSPRSRTRVRLPSSSMIFSRRISLARPIVHVLYVAWYTIYQPTLRTVIHRCDRLELAHFPRGSLSMVFTALRSLATTNRRQKRHRPAMRMAAHKRKGPANRSRRASTGPLRASLGSKSPGGLAGPLHSQSYLNSQMALPGFVWVA